MEQSAYRETTEQAPPSDVRIRTLGELDRALRDLTACFAAASPECEPFVAKIAELSAAVSDARITRSGIAAYYRGPLR
jgi:hypothetical protein